MEKKKAAKMAALKELINMMRAGEVAKYKKSPKKEEEEKEMEDEEEVCSECDDGSCPECKKKPKGLGIIIAVGKPKKD